MQTTVAERRKPSKPRLPAIEYIRGISMLGVIGIHVGAQYLQNPALNVHVLAVLEIVTRFSVPIFFFISAFGLFYNLAPTAPFSYGKFLRRRGRAVFVPYLTWSIFYLALSAVLYETAFPTPGTLFYTLFFGLASYQLYFLVILLWFYLLMPLWIYIMRRLTTPRLWILFALQVVVNYWSSFSPELYAYTLNLPEDSWWRALLAYRLNYWVGHYFFIFLLGGHLAWHWDSFRQFMQERRFFIYGGFCLSLMSLLGYYYNLLARGYTPLETVFTAHQLCPLGICYTVAASVFFFTLFTLQPYGKKLNELWSFLGKHSYFCYLVHPVFIGIFARVVSESGRIMTASLTAVFYLSVLVSSLFVACVCRRIGEKTAVLNLLTIGLPYKKK